MVSTLKEESYDTINHQSGVGTPLCRIFRKDLSGAGKSILRPAVHVSILLRSQRTFQTKEASTGKTLTLQRVVVFEEHILLWLTLPSLTFGKDISSKFIIINISCLYQKSIHTKWLSRLSYLSYLSVFTINKKLYNIAIIIPTWYRRK